MFQTYQTKLQNIQLPNDKELFAFDYLDEFSKRFGQLERKLFLLLYVKKETSTSVKNSFSKRNGLTSRQYNALKFQLDGKVTSIKEVQEYQLKLLEGKMSEIQKTIENKEKQKERLHKKLRKMNEQNEDFWTVQKKYKSCKFVLHQKKRKLRNQTHKLTKLRKKMERDVVSICFGSRTLFLKQFHLEENEYKHHKEWLDEWREARSTQFITIGSKDESFGNQTTTYDVDNTLRLRVSNEYVNTYGPYLTFPNVQFHYGQEHIDQAKISYEGITKGGKKAKYYRAITYRFMKRNNKWYVLATVDIDPPEIVTKREVGYIGIDFNVGFLTICEIDRFGNPIKEWSIKVRMYDRTTEQIKAELSDALKSIFNYAQKVGKPVVYENLSFFSKKKALGETSRKYSRMLSGFGFSTYKDAIESKGVKCGVETIGMNPAYTSQIGHMKFMSRYGLSSHGSAACMIARRAMTKKWVRPNYLTNVGFPKSFDKNKPNRNKWVSLSTYTRNNYDFKYKIELLKMDM